MQRLGLALGFTLGFTVVIALAGAWSTPVASQTDGRTLDTPNTAWISLPSNPSHTSFGTLMPDGTYRGVTTPDGTSDETHCTVGCPAWDAID
jgi:hypothetical protein